ncbi:hypothetical protein AVEN_22336-1, partial [Araneus ventricosus]
EHEGLFGRTDTRIYGTSVQMTRTTPTSSPQTSTPPTGGRLAIIYDLKCNRPSHGGSSVESGFRTLGSYG